MCCSEIVAESALEWRKGRSPKYTILEGACWVRWGTQGHQERGGLSLAELLQTQSGLLERRQSVCGYSFPNALSPRVCSWDDGTFHVFWAQDDAGGGRQVQHGSTGSERMPKTHEIYISIYIYIYIYYVFIYIYIYLYIYFIDIYFYIYLYKASIYK